MTIEDKRRAAENILRSFDRVIVAFSGGVDSTLLAKLARDLLGKPNALAVTADSPSMARDELDASRHLAVSLDLEHLVIATTEVNRQEYQANTGARCFFCKQTLFEALEGLAAAQGRCAVLYGAIADDALRARPGHRAALQHGVRAPLQEAGLEKWEIRELAQALGLPNWDKPQNACLSSRIPHGEPVTEGKLRQIELGERFLREQGFRQIRVRHLGTHARIEVGTGEVGRFNDAALRVAVEQQFERIGFETVGVDRFGYREGGADHMLVDEVSLSAISRC